MNRKRLLFALLFASTAFSAFAYSFSAVAPSGQILYYNVVGISSSSVHLTAPNYYNWNGYTQPEGTLIIPDSVTYNGTTYSVSGISASTFHNCTGLTSVVIPRSIDYIDGNPFRGCYGITSISVASDNPLFDSRNNCNAIISSTVDSLITGCRNTIIPNSVTRIGQCSFLDCTSLTNITIPNSVSSIAASAFYGCINIDTLYIPTTVTSIGSYAFYNVPCIYYEGNAGGRPWGAQSTVTYIEDSLIYSGYSKTILVSCINGITSATIPNTVVKIEDNAFKNCSTLVNVTIPNSVTYIGSSAFYGCSGLTSVTIPNSVTSIGEMAFYNCSGLTSVNIGNSVTSIGNYAFYGCSGLTSIVVEEGNTHYDSRDNCNAIIQTDLNLLVQGCNTTVIPNTVTAIGSYAFYNCGSLTSVTIPNSVTSIGSNAFSGCDGLKVMWMKPTIPPTLYNASSLGADSVTLVVPHNSYNAYTNAGAYYKNHLIYRDSIIVTTLVNDTLMGYVTGVDSVLVYPYENDTVSLTATAFYGYYFVRWDDNSTDNPLLIVTDSSVTRTAIFDINKYHITLQADTSIHGSCNGSGNYNYLSERNIHANANHGYHFTHWQDGDTNNPRTFILTQDTSFIAYYDKNTYTLTFQSADTNMGIVNTISVTGEYLDTTMQIYATAIPHYHFVRWNDYNTENPRRFVFNDNRTYTAFFAIDVHTVGLQVDNLAHGTINGAGSREYGQPITVEATPYSGYQFTHWSDGSTYNPYTFAVLEDRVLTAFFVADGEPWQDTVVLYDTTYVLLHDTAYINVPVHDTTYIDVHDTTIITDTVTLTEYVPVHDTTYINVPVYDTTYITQFVHDTTVVTDTVTLTEYVSVHDTTYITQTDTLTVTQYDTITNTVYDTIDNYIYDTTIVVDTLWLTEYDTVWLHDTTFIHDTVYITEEGIGDAETINAKVYSSRGQIVVEGADGNRVTLYDVTGRVLATKQDDYSPLHFDAPASGTYIIKIGAYPARRVVVIR